MCLGGLLGKDKPVEVSMPAAPDYAAAGSEEAYRERQRRAGAIGRAETVLSSLKKESDQISAKAKTVLGG